MHGYAIAQLIQQISDDLLRVEEGSLYPALQRLGLSANNRRARFYKLTPDGGKHLAGESARYRQVTGAVARVMGFADAHANPFQVEESSTPFTVLAAPQRKAAPTVGADGVSYRVDDSRLDCGTLHLDRVQDRSDGCIAVELTEANERVRQGATPRPGAIQDTHKFLRRGD